MTFIQSNKGKLLLILNGCLYKCNKKTKAKKYWICISDSCKVYVHTDLNDGYLFGGKGEHNHGPNPDMITAKQVRNNIKERALGEGLPIAMICEQELAKVSSNPTALAILPTTQEMCTFSERFSR